MKPDNKTKLVQAPLRNQALAARLLVAPIFLASAALKTTNWEFFLGYTESTGLPFASALLAASIAVELAGGTMLLTGYRSRLAAAALALYLVPTTLIFHQFWAADPTQVTTQLLEFTKNLAVIGALLGVAGARRGVSIDSSSMGEREVEA